MNVSGGRGQNIPTDLHMEHLNKRLKKILRLSGSNIIKPNTIVRAAKTIGFVHHVCSVFESGLGCAMVSPHRKHKPTSFDKDLALITNVLKEQNVFIVNKRKRCHPSFPIKKTLIRGLDENDVLDWLITEILPSLIFT